MDLANLFSDYTKYGVYHRGWDPKTRAIYERAFTGLQQSFRGGATGNRTEPAQQDLESRSPALEHAHLITKTQLEAWIVWMRVANRSPAYINIHIRAINAFLRWLKNEGHVADLLNLKKVPDPPKPVTDVLGR